MELTNEIVAAGPGASDADVGEAIDALVRMLAPMAPFISEELWHRLGRDGSVHKADWPEADASLVREETAMMVVQVNGKVRDKIDVPTDVSEDQMVERARASDKVRAHLEGHEVIKTIAVPPKLINFVVR